MQFTLCVKNLFVAMVLAEVPSGLFSEPVSTSAPENGFAPLSILTIYIYQPYEVTSVHLLQICWRDMTCAFDHGKLAEAWWWLNHSLNSYFLNAFIFFFNFYFVSTLL